MTNGPIDEAPVTMASPPETVSATPPTMELPAHRGRLARVFRNDTELRAGWRLLIFVAIVAPPTIAYFWGIQKTMHGAPMAARFIVREVAGLIVVTIATAIMARFERRPFGVYGLPWRRRAWPKVGRGALLGFGWLAALVLTLQALGLAHGMTLALHGPSIALWGGGYLLVFVLLAVREEFTNRGYALFTLGSGIGFWWAAFVTSALFGLGHRTNSGEDWIGLVNAGLFGLVACFLLRRTGDLWTPIGVHMAWDWGQTYFFGTADSGAVAPGHLLTTTPAGPAWASGGSVGPEGSVLCTLFILLFWAGCAAWLPRSVNAATVPPLEPAISLPPA